MHSTGQPTVSAAEIVAAAMTSGLKASEFFVALKDAAKDDDDGDLRFKQWLASQGCTDSSSDIFRELAAFQASRLDFWDGLYELRNETAAVATLAILGGVPYIAGTSGTEVTYRDSRLRATFPAGALDVQFSIDDTPSASSLFRKACSGTLGAEQGLTAVYHYTLGATPTPPLDTFNGTYTVKGWSAKSEVYYDAPPVILNVTSDTGQFTMGARQVSIVPSMHVETTRLAFQDQVTKLGVDITFATLPDPSTNVFSGRIWDLEAEEPRSPNVEGRIVAAATPPPSPPDTPDNPWDSYGITTFVFATVIGLAGIGVTIFVGYKLAKMAPVFQKRFETLEKIRRGELGPEALDDMFYFYNDEKDTDGKDIIPLKEIPGAAKTSLIATTPRAVADLTQKLSLERAVQTMIVESMETRAELMRNAYTQLAAELDQRSRDLDAAEAAYTDKHEVDAAKERAIRDAREAVDTATARIAENEAKQAALQERVREEQKRADEIDSMIYGKP